MNMLRVLEACKIVPILLHNRNMFHLIYIHNSIPKKEIHIFLTNLHINVISGRPKRHITVVPRHCSVLPSDSIYKANSVGLSMDPWGPPKWRSTTNRTSSTFHIPFLWNELMLIFLMLTPEYFRRSSWIAWRLVPWLLVLQGISSHVIDNVASIFFCHVWGTFSNIGVTRNTRNNNKTEVGTPSNPRPP